LASKLSSKRKALHTLRRNNPNLMEPKNQKGVSNEAKNMQYQHLIRT